MPIDYQKLKNWPFKEIAHTYTQKDCMLYALGIGLGADPLDEQQLRFVYEKELQVLPTMGVVLASPGFWLQDPGTALVAVGLSSVWANLGFTFILVTAGLQSIPRDLHEAAAVDGAGGVRRFWSITVPLLGPTLLFVVVVSTTRAFQAYGEIDLLTQGGPSDSTMTKN